MRRRSPLLPSAARLLPAGASRSSSASTSASHFEPPTFDDERMRHLNLGAWQPIRSSARIQQMIDDGAAPAGRFSLGRKRSAAWRNPGIAGGLTSGDGARLFGRGTSRRVIIATAGRRCHRKLYGRQVHRAHYNKDRHRGRVPAPRCSAASAPGTGRQPLASRRAALWT